MMNKDTTYTINFQPIGKRAKVQEGSSLLNAAQAAGIELISLCGGVGACDSCKVRLVSGKLSDLSLEEQALFGSKELADGYRLACQSFPQSDVIIDIPPESLTTPQRLQVEDQTKQVELDPVVFPVELQLPPPSLEDLRSDLTRLRESWPAEMGAAPNLNRRLLATFSQQLRHWNWQVRLAVRKGQPPEIVALLPPTPPGERPTSLLGLAVDVGTTKLAAFLVDLGNGETIARLGAMNPQIAFGEDVVSRIAHANRQPDGARGLQERLIERLNEMIQSLCEQATQAGQPSQPAQIVEAVVVGNTAMHHIFAGLSISQLGTAPFVASVSEALDIPARQLGLDIAPGAYVHLPPNIAGYVGADHIAMLLASLPEPLPEAGGTIALDIGTNTEITLASRGRLVSCSCASGPAFEGAHIRDGMRAAPGAIEAIQIDSQGVRIHTIGGQPPVGICGSGILDAIAEMVNHHLLDRRGVLLANHAAIRPVQGKNALLLADANTSGTGREVLVTRQDVNQIQLAKGAIRAGIEVLVEAAGLSHQELGSEIQNFIVAGAFGTYIRIESALTIGMFPQLPLERFQQIGNAAGAGARRMLLSRRQRQRATELARQIEYVELSAHPGFLREFSAALFFSQAHS